MLSVLLGIATARGDRGEPEAGEDIDLEHRLTWSTVVELVEVLVCTIATVDFLGWASPGGPVRRLRMGAGQPHPGA